MSADFAKRVLQDIARGNLEQGWALLEDEQYDLALHHFREAVTQVEQMKEMASQQKLTAPKQAQLPCIEV